MSGVRHDLRDAPAPVDTPPAPATAGLPPAPVAGGGHRRGGWDEGSRWPAMFLIVALHAGMLYGLMQIESVRNAVEEVAPIMVGLITLPPPEPPKPRIEPPPKPQPLRPKVEPKPQMIVSEAPSPEPVMVAPPPEPVVEEPPAPPPPAPPAPPAPVIPPNFLAAYLDNPAPVYPSRARDLGESGTTILRVLVDENGRPKSIDIETSSGSARLDRAAADAVKKWKFVAARHGDQAVSAYVLVPLAFKLR